jgi:hypothetical protein
MHIPHKKKFFIKSQIPQYIREEYPLFLELMEQYYSFLDSEEGKIIAVKVIEGGSGYNPVSEWAGNTSYTKGQRFSFNNKIYSVVQDATSSGSNSSFGMIKSFTLPSVNGSTDSIDFGTNHNLNSGDEVVYSFNGATGPNNSTGVVGLIDNGTYWVGVNSPTTIKLYSDRTSALALGASGLIDLSSIGATGISGLTINNPGVSNTMAPSTVALTFTGGGGIGASGIAKLEYGSTGVYVSSVNLLNSGTGYTSAPNVSIVGATGFTTNFSITAQASFNQTHKFTVGPWYSGATGLSTFANVTAKYITEGGPESVIVYFITKNASGQYVTDPRAGSASGAAAVPILDSGAVKKIVITNPGSGYTKEEEPLAIITGGGGSGAVLETVTTTDFGGLNASVTAAQYSRDVDETIERCIQSLRRELIPNIPDKLYLESDNLAESREVDVRKFIKFIKQFYNSKGAEKSIQFLFRILFDSDVEIYYPKTDMLRVSDGKWSEDYVIRVNPLNPSETEESFTESYVGERIIGVDSGATATIQSVVDVGIAGGGLTLELRLNEINGTFETDEEIKVYSYDRTRSEESIAVIRPCISSLNILDGGINYSIDDQILTDSSFLARVTAIGTVTEEPKYFDISSQFGEVSKSFDIKTDVNTISKTITFNTPHNYSNGDSVVYSLNNSEIGTPIAEFDIISNVDAQNDCIILDNLHNYSDGDRVIYSFAGATGPEGATGVIGLNDNKTYWVRTSFNDDSKIVAEVEITEPGSGYTSAPVITFSNPFTGATGATGFYNGATGFFIGATGSNIGSTGFVQGTIIGVNFEIPGATGVSTKFYRSYASVPNYTLTPLHSIGATGYWEFIGRNALATANIGLINGATGITSITITDHGFGYGINPTITFSSGNAEATAKMYSDIRGRYVRLYDSYFNSTLGSTGLIVISQSGTSQTHKLYLSPIGLKESATYYARITGSTGVQLYTSQAAAIAGTTGLLVSVESNNLSERIKVHSLTKLIETPYIDVSSKTITFKTPHNFKTGRGLLYSFNGSTGPAGATGALGLNDGTTYYARITGSTGVQLYTTYAGAIAGTTGLLVSLGSTGLHQTHSLSQVSVNSITDYKIQNFGFNYQTQPEFETTGGSGASFSANLSGLLKYDGSYIGTDGQPSSAKKIQDSEYYQDFSYEIISDQSARIFGTILEKTIHPAGLRYFSKILSVRDESLYDERDNYNAYYEQYTYFVTDPLGQSDFDIDSLLNNGTEWQAGDIVSVGTLENPTKIFLRSGSEDYVFIVSGSGTFDSTPPSITSGEQTNGTAKLIFSGVADKVLTVYVDGVLQEYGTDYTMQDANTIEFSPALPQGSIVRIYRREEILIETDYNEYVQSFTSVLSRRNKFVRDSFDAYRWYPGIETTPKLWQQTGATGFLLNDIVKWNNNYYLVTKEGEPGTNPPTHIEGSYPNGTTILQYYPPFVGYNGDILYNGLNFYKVTGNSIANFSAEFGSTGPVHTVGIIDAIISNGGVSNYMSPGGYSLVFTGATGSGAAGTANLAWGSTGVYVSSVDITTSGSDYFVSPTVTISGATGFTTNYSITPIIGPATAINGKTYLTNYDPGYSFWTGSTGVDVDDILKSNGNWYRVITSGTTDGSSGPTHNLGSQLSGTARLEYYPIDHAKTTILPVVSQLDPGKAMLGPTVNDIARNIGAGIPDFFQDIFGTISVSSSTSYTDLDLGETGLSDQDDEYIDYTIIITFPDSTKAIRTITDYDGSTKTVTLSSSISTGAYTSLTFRMIQNYLISSVNSGTFVVPDSGSTGLSIGLSSFDLAYNLNPLTGATGVLGATGITKYTFNSATAIVGATGPSGSVGATGYMINIPIHQLTTANRLTYNNNGNSNLTGLTSGNSYYVIVVDQDYIQLADTYDNAISGATGATGFIGISPGSGSHKLHPQNDLYKNFNLIISSGGGANTVLNIKEYDEITNTVQCYGNPTGTILANDSTYFIYPDLYAYPGGATGPSGANYNDNHYGGSILALIISSGGFGYSVGNSISFSGGYGTGAAATVTSVDGSGRILDYEWISQGSGYIYEPRITISAGATGVVGTQAAIYPVLSPLNSAVSVETISRYSMFGHYQYNVNSASISTTCSSASGLDYITLTDNTFDTNNLYVGQSVSGSGIAANTRVRDISGSKVYLDKTTTSTSSFTVTFTGKPHPSFEYGETLVQQSTVNPSILNKVRVVKYDRINKVLYVEKDEESDELNNVNNLTRSKNNSTIDISTGSEMYSGWKSINQPIGCIIKSYPL